MKVNEINAKKLIVKSNLPASDYVINPYVGCTHNCKYCYASFMRRFTGHLDDEWGTFLDVKNCECKSLPRNLSGKTVLLSSVTDPYNPYEKKYHSSREALMLLRNTGAHVEVLTKSDLVLSDIDVLKQISDIKVGISMNTLDDEFRKDIEPGAPSIERRLKALKQLYNEGISTYVMLSPIFPGITDINLIVNEVKEYVPEIAFENLNLRGVSKTYIFEYIRNKKPQLLPLYESIYTHKDNSYWNEMETLIHTIQNENPHNKFINYFYHEKIKKGN